MASQSVPRRCSRSRGPCASLCSPASSDAAAPATATASDPVISRLAPSVYNALKSELLKQTCINLTGYKLVDIPILTLQFEDGMEVDVDVSGVFYFV